MSAGSLRLGPPASRRAEAVEDAAEQAIADGDPERRSGRRHPGPGPYAVQLAERHQQRAAVAEPDDLGHNGGAVAVRSDEAHLADLRLQAGRLDDQADQVADVSVAAGEIRLPDRL